MAVKFDQRVSAPWAFPLIGILAVAGGVVGAALWPELQGAGEYIQCFLLSAVVTALFPGTWLVAWIVDQTVRPRWERRKAGHPG